MQTCCADLGNLSDWRAAMYRGAAWEMLRIGHPWLSIRYDDQWLVLSEPHESETPIARWAVLPDNLERAVDQAATELEAFAGRLRPVIAGAVGDQAAQLIARRLAGLAE